MGEVPPLVSYLVPHPELRAPVLWLDGHQETRAQAKATHGANWVLTNVDKCGIIYAGVNIVKHRRSNDERKR